MVNRNTVLMPASDLANAFPRFISFKTPIDLAHLVMAPQPKSVVATA